jgi:hypothetical protein
LPKPIIRSRPDIIGYTGESEPRLIVGVCPNSHAWQRSDLTYPAFSSWSVSGKIIHRAALGLNDVWLTNVVNLSVKESGFTPALVEQGLSELDLLVSSLRPIAIACVGSRPFKLIKGRYGCKIAGFDHPAFVNRFHHSSVSSYVLSLRNFIKPVKGQHAHCHR